MGSRLEVARPILEDLAGIEARLKAARRVAALLDFDGTLAEIVPVPGAAQLAPEMRVALLSLSRNPRVTVAILSGRELEDVRERVGIAGLIYAGCHGLAISGRGLERVDPQAQMEGPTLMRLAAQLQDELHAIDGARVEDKGMAVSVHFRQVSTEPERQRVARIVQSAVERYGERFRLTLGKEVWEIVPKVDWGKGRAARWILGQVGEGDALPVCIGDDQTDEDAFRELAEGITIKVGDPTGSAAAWMLADMGQVRTFLAWLGSTLD